MTGGPPGLPLFGLDANGSVSVKAPRTPRGAWNARGTKGVYAAGPPLQEESRSDERSDQQREGDRNEHEKELCHPCQRPSGLFVAQLCGTTLALSGRH